MPGGPAEPNKPLGPQVDETAAQARRRAVLTYIGPDGAGHFVKMVHNGIEYADMQMIGEAYELLGPARQARTRNGRGFRGMEQGRARYLPDRDHRAGAAPDRRRDRRIARRYVKSDGETDIEIYK